MTFKTTLLWTLVLLFARVIAQVRSTDQFQSWYPEYRGIFQKVLRENCSDEYAYYLAGQTNSSRLDQDKWNGAGTTNQLAFPPASCILNNVSEWVKFNMASAAGLLGLTPSILAALGPSVEEVTSLFILARRPLPGMSRRWNTFFVLIPNRQPSQDVGEHKGTELSWASDKGSS